MRPHMCRDFSGFSGLLADDSAPFVPEFCLLFWGDKNHLSDADDAELSNVLPALVFCRGGRRRTSSGRTEAVIDPEREEENLNLFIN